MTVLQEHSVGNGICWLICEQGERELSAESTSATHSQSMNVQEYYLRFAVTSAQWSLCQYLNGLNLPASCIGTKGGNTYTVAAASLSTIVSRRMGGGVAARAVLISAGLGTFTDFPK